MKSALDSAVENALDDVLLEAEVEDNDRRDGDDHAGHDRAPFYLAVAALEGRR